MYNNNAIFLLKTFKSWYRRDGELWIEKNSQIRSQLKKRARGRIEYKGGEGERAGKRAADVSRTYIPFMLLEHAFLAKRNSRGTVRKIGPITARPPCGSLDPRREQYGSRTSRFIAERLVNKAPISALFRRAIRGPHFATPCRKRSG